MDFDPAIEAQLAGQVVRGDLLAEFQFVSGTVRLWNGFGTLTTLDGHSWKGLCGMARIEGLQQSFNGSAPELSLNLSGVDATFAAKARAEADDYYGQIVRIWAQWFDEDWQPLGLPYARQGALMRQIKAVKQSNEDGFEYRVELSAESPFAGRRRPRYGFMTDRDQQLRFPGDRGCERVAGIQQKIINFPDF